MEYKVVIKGVHWGSNRVAPGWNDKLAEHNRHYQKGAKVEREMVLVCLNFIHLYLRNVRIEKPISITYTHYEADMRRDLGNIGFIDKPFEDALQHANIIKNDNLACVQEIRHIFGGVDKTNPRIEIFIEEL